MSESDRTGTRLPVSKRAAAILLAGVVPWLVVPYGDGFSLVLSLGLLNPETFAFTSVYQYVFVYTRDIPANLLAWPTATLLYITGVGSAALARIDREDRRVTTGLFALAAFDICYAAVGFSAYRAGVVALPLGAAPLALAAWTSRP